MRDSFWRAIFLSAAIFNWIVGLSVAFDTRELAASMGLETLHYDAFYSPVAGWFIILFGMLYFAVWRDLANRAIVVIGTIGKLGAFVLTMAAVWRGLAPTSMAGVVAIDLIYAVLFAAFLFRRQAALAKS